ncbi:hypothetical protein FKW77_003872 [Venturia effusa]|uniref:CNNM transmembrane domain-containing protein n=1 Tax=Venturia effusa TaxID=50376 RepID=A0A517L911_9PEZI|nr:hypothetical protein FKW77_003872 [Venturia effusa]
MAASTSPTNPIRRRQPSSGCPSCLRIPAISVASSLLIVAIASLPGATAVPISEAAGDVYPYAGAEPKPAEDASLWLYLTTAALLVILGGVFAGLTIALMGQDEIYLQVIATSGEGAERKNATKVLRLLKRGKHWVLVTLLLGNVITNETLPIVLDRSLGGGWPAVLGSTVLIVIFGEVAPQSICVRYGLPIGAFMAPFVLVLMWLLAPVAWPTAKLLDYLLGEDHGTTYKKAGLKTLVTLHRTLGQTPGERLNQDEVTIISAVLDLKEKSVGSIMTPMADTFTLSLDTVLDEDMMDSILSEGYSRIPIYAVNNPRDFVGMLLVKMLITYDPDDALRVRDFQLATLPETRPETSCLDIVNFFQEGKSHMVLVSDYPGEPNGALGVVTLEDVIEELIGEEIIDESDVFIDVHKAVRRLHPAPFNRVRRADKGEILTTPDVLVPDSEQEGLLEASDKDQGTGGRPSRAASVTETPKKHVRRQSTSEMSKSPPGTTFMMRRRSSGGEPQAMRSSNADIRQHLKHLGPSNAASRPKATRIGTVHIKPGHVDTLATLPETAQLRTSPSPARLTPPSPRSIPRSSDVNESTGLLSAGHSAKDGVHALSYGAFTNSQTAKHQDLEGHQDDAEDSTTAVNEEEAPSSRTEIPSPKPEQDLLTGSPSASPKPKSSSSPKAGSSTSPVLSKQPSRSSSTAVEPPPKYVLDMAKSKDNVADVDGSLEADSRAVSPPPKMILDLAPSKEDLARLEATESASATGRSDRDKRPVSRKTSSSTIGSLRSIDNSDSHKKRRVNTRSGSISETIVEVGGVKKMIIETTSSSDGDEDSNGGVSVSANNGKENANGSGSNNATENDADKEGDGGKSAAAKKKRKKNKHKKKGKGTGMGDSQTLTN